MTVTVARDVAGGGDPQPGDVLHVPTAALAELGVAVDHDEAAVAAAARWETDVVAAESRDQSVRLILAALAGVWSAPRGRACRCVAGRDDLRPSLPQALLAQQVVRAAGQQVASLVAHACAWVAPSAQGAVVHRSHDPRACLALFEVWCWPPDEPLVGDAPALGRPGRTRRAGRYGQAAGLLREFLQANAAAEQRPVTQPYTTSYQAEAAELVAWRLGTCLEHIRWVDGTLRQAETAGALALFAAWKAELRRTQALADIAAAWDAHATAEKTRIEAGASA